MNPDLESPILKKDNLYWVNPFNDKPLVCHDILSSLFIIPNHKERIQLLFFQENPKTETSQKIKIHVSKTSQNISGSILLNPLQDLHPNLSHYIYYSILANPNINCHIDRKFHDVDIILNGWLDIKLL